MLTAILMMDTEIKIITAFIGDYLCVGVPWLQNIQDCCF